MEPLSIAINKSIDKSKYICISVAINKSIETSTLPNCKKVAKVVPILNWL